MLAALGLDEDRPDVRAEAMRIARRLHASGAKAIGLVPGDARVAVPPIAIEIGLALCDLTGASVAVVDANVRYPALSSIVRGEAVSADHSVFATRWLLDSLALLVPPRVERAGEVVPQLARLLLEGANLFQHILCDLTGLEVIGEHGSAAACMDAVILLGRAHKIHEAELLALSRLMPQGRFMGVLLVG